MAGNSFGQLFRITTFGESHGPGIGVVIDGCPSNLNLDRKEIQRELTRRRPGQSALTTSRDESDSFQFLSGMVDNVTTGAPLTIWIPNTDQRSADYGHIKDVFRPSHADFTYQKKYGIRDVKGGGRSSARETAARVAAGAVARQLLNTIGLDCVGYVTSVGNIEMSERDASWTRQDVDVTAVRCPDAPTASSMIKLIEEVRDAGDTIGGVVECSIRNCPIGFGDPVYGKLHAELGSAILSINACKGFEIGSGFRGTKMRGSEHNDAFVSVDGKISTSTNNSGGIQGGISNGMEITIRAAFKPVSTLMQSQSSVDKEGKPVTVEGKGRHDPCVVPRAVPIVEAMALITLADHWLRSKASGPL